MKKLTKSQPGGGYGSNKRWLIILVTVFVLLLIGTSYALWQITFRQTGTNTVTTDCFKVEFTDKNPITLGEAYPLSDGDAINLTPYEFSITNICSDHVRYEVNLEILDETTLGNLSYIKTMYNENDPKILTEYESIEPTLSNAVDSYNLDVGYLETNEKKTFNLRLWLSVDTPLNEDTMNKTLSSRVTVTTSYAKKLPGTLRRVTNTESSGMWEYKENITKLVIQNKLNKINGAVKVSDESVTKDESIMSYVVPNEDGETYTAYLQGQDVIYLNPDSSYLFYKFNKLENIDGIKNLNTSSVVNMNRLFSECNSLVSLDLSSFDTSEVTTMYYMFDRCYKLANLDVSSFNTNKVTDMSSMFHYCSNLTNLDVSNFDTSNVTNMDSMFAYCRKIVNLDLNNFDTSKVTSMFSMFSECNSLIELDLSKFNTSNVTSMGEMFERCEKLVSISGINFNTSKVTSMFQMFYHCSSLETLDLSSFNTQNVTNMASMFDSCRVLNNLNISQFDTSQVTDMLSMFTGCSSLTDILYGSNFVHKSGCRITSMFSNCPANKPTHSSWNGVTF